MGHQRMADIGGQRQQVPAATLATNERLTAAPVDMSEMQPDEPACAQLEPCQQ
jgi:hypothetical protein